MITDKAKHKAKVLSFWQKHKLEATKEAFGVKERTLYNWKRQLKKGQGEIESLNDKSKRPKKVRCRRIEWPIAIKIEIKRIREEHPNLGKDKIYPFLLEFCNEQKLVALNQQPSAT